MRNNKSYTQKYTELNREYQLVLPFNFEVLIPEDDSVRLLSQLLEGLNYDSLYLAYSSVGRKPAVDPKILFKVLTYAYMNQIYSSRKIERACRRDINFMWLLEGAPAPDHCTIARFRKTVLGETAEDLFYQLVLLLHQQGEVAFEHLFVDGTKIEASANRYSFVWKKSILKNEARMFLRIQDSLREINVHYGTEFVVSSEACRQDLQAVLGFLVEQRRRTGTVFVHGTGKRKSDLQRQTELFQTYLERQTAYEKHQELLGSRNSYSKTDPDATFMRMKDDHMRNGQLKPGYNVQIGVESEYITALAIFPDCNDLHTLVPLLERVQENLSLRHRKIVADAGYESEENYTYLAEHGQECFIKPQNYERMKTRTFRQDIGRRENMTYDLETDAYLCHEGRPLVPVGGKKRTSSNGYVSRITLYECISCADCPVSDRCKKGTGNKQLQAGKIFMQKREQSLKRITSGEGILLRMNRSIQVEGAFGVLKNDYGFKRFLTRGKVGVMTELTLLCLAYNINKLHAKIQNDRMGHTLHPIKEAI